MSVGEAIVMMQEATLIPWSSGLCMWAELCESLGTKEADLHCLHEWPSRKERILGQQEAGELGKWCHWSQAKKCCWWVKTVMGIKWQFPYLRGEERVSEVSIRPAKERHAYLCSLG